MKMLSLFMLLGLALLSINPLVTLPPDNQPQKISSIEKPQHVLALEYFDINALFKDAAALLTDADRASFNPLEMLPDEVRKSYLFLEKFIIQVMGNEKKITQEKMCLIASAEQFLKSVSYERLQELIKHADFMGMKVTVPYKVLIYHMIDSYIKQTQSSKEQDLHSWVRQLSPEFLSLFNKYAWLFFDTEIIKSRPVDPIVFDVTLSELKEFDKLPKNQHDHMAAHLIDLHIGSIDDLPHHLSHETKYLLLPNNNIRSISRKSFIGLHNLVSLSLMNCGIQEIELGSFNNLRQLKTLFLELNKLTQITDVVLPLLKMQQLSGLHVYDNQLSEQEEQNLLKAIVQSHPDLLTCFCHSSQKNPYTIGLRMRKDPEENAQIKALFLLQQMWENKFKGQETADTVS